MFLLIHFIYKFQLKLFKSDFHPCLQSSKEIQIELTFDCYRCSTVYTPLANKVSTLKLVFQYVNNPLASAFQHNWVKKNTYLSKNEVHIAYVIIVEDPLSYMRYSTSWVTMEQTNL